MKHVSLVFVLALFACGQDPQSGSHTSRLAQSAEASPIPAKESLPSTASLSEAEVKTAFAKADATVSSSASFSTSSSSSSVRKDFKSEASLEVEATFCAAKAKNGKKLSPQACAELSLSFMQVVDAAATKDAAKTSQAWNQFMGQVGTMHKKAQLNAKAQGGLIPDILGLAVDSINLVVDLLTAVLALDVAGVIKVAQDAIKLVIDFLV